MKTGSEGGKGVFKFSNTQHNKMMITKRRLPATLRTIAKEKGRKLMGSPGWLFFQVDWMKPGLTCRSGRKDRLSDFLAHTHAHLRSRKQSTQNNGKVGHWQSGVCVSTFPPFCFAFLPERNWVFKGEGDTISTLMMIADCGGRCAKRTFFGGKIVHDFSCKISSRFQR